MRATKSLVLSLVVVGSLALAGAAGVFATWSDSETSMDNIIETGSVDLKVNGADDAPWGTGVPAKVNIECMIPAKWYGPYEVELWNAGQCNFPSHAYIHIKDLVCSNAPPKINPYPNGGSAYWPADASTGYPDPSTGQPYSGDLKPEPELVAEYGGKVNCHWVTGIGPEGDDCSMGTHVRMKITKSINPMDILVNPQGVSLQNRLGKWECQEIWLFDLMPCNARTIYLWFRLEQEDEDDYDDVIPDPGEPGYDLLEWKKFNDWPSWALMKDKVTFTMEFDLWLEDP